MYSWFSMKTNTAP